MASARAGNPYDNYDSTEIEQDLIDPDDGQLYSIFCPYIATELSI